MLLSSDAKKVMVCAPSNAAVDEVVSRLSTVGLIGSDIAVDGILLRVGALDYEPTEAVKRHTLDERVAKYQEGLVKKRDDKLVEKFLIKESRVICCTLAVAG